MDLDRNKAVVLLSGGITSAVALGHCKDLGLDVTALGIDYGQRQCKELKAAERIASKYALVFEVVDINVLKPHLGGSSQTDFDIQPPDGHYADPAQKVTVVPNRNMLLASIALSHCITRGIGKAVFGFRYKDPNTFPDNRPEFIDKLREMAELCHFDKLDIWAPFIAARQYEIVSRGARDLSEKFAVPFELTWSCLRGGAKHCGRCAGCFERHEAFMQAELEDPTAYEQAKAEAAELEQ